MSGYSICNFVHPLLKRHECPLCQLAMRNPMQTECGHLFCKDCLEPLLNKPSPRCPLDREPISKEGVFPDNACRREILNLDIKCGLPGCKWVGKLKDLETHTDECDYSDVQCKTCGNYVLRNSLSSHQKNDCPMRPEPCVHCNQNIPFQQMLAHLANVCPEVLRPCPYNCNPKLQMNLHQVEKHVSDSDGDCPLSTMKCPYSIFNCTFVSLRRNIETHLQQCVVYHAQIQAQNSLIMMQEVEKMKSFQKNQNKRIVALEQCAESKMKQRFRLLGVASGHMDPNKHACSMEASSIQQNQIEGVTLPASLTMQQFEARSSKVTELDHSLDRCLSSSLDQELRLQLLERAPYNSILLWKIDDFSRRRREAVEGVTMSLYSTPFYTSRHGYKMCARVYLNGDSLGKGTHLSFFFVIMRGPCDAQLMWPFKQKVTLTLLNQVGKKHVTDSFLPDPQSSSFQLPGRKEMNIASGYPMDSQRKIGFRREFDLQFDCSIYRHFEGEKVISDGSGSLFFPLQNIGNYMQDNSLYFLLEPSEVDPEPETQYNEPGLDIDELTFHARCMHEVAHNQKQRITALKQT